MLWYNPFRATDFFCDVMDGCSIILYAIALADQDQEQASDARRVLRAKEGFATLALYLASASSLWSSPGMSPFPFILLLAIHENG
jgi:hypothetical protein